MEEILHVFQLLKAYNSFLESGLIAASFNETSKKASFFITKLIEPRQKAHASLSHLRASAFCNCPSSLIISSQVYVQYGSLLFGILFGLLSHGLMP